MSESKEELIGSLNIIYLHILINMSDAVGLPKTNCIINQKHQIFRPSKFELAVMDFYKII
jgi:hypothetical protein